MDQQAASHLFFDSTSFASKLHQSKIRQAFGPQHTRSPNLVEYSPPTPPETGPPHQAPETPHWAGLELDRTETGLVEWELYLVGTGNRTGLGWTGMARCCSAGLDDWAGSGQGQVAGHHLF